MRKRMIAAVLTALSLVFLGCRNRPSITDKSGTLLISNRTDSWLKIEKTDGSGSYTLIAPRAKGVKIQIDDYAVHPQRD
jgi:type IV pilus biogenesis protein CpaD/CtpE